MAAERSTAVATATGPQESDELRRLREGTLSVEEYLDLQVNRAVSPWQGQVSNRRLELMKGVLREQISSSPALIELLQRMGLALPGSDGA